MCVIFVWVRARMRKLPAVCKFLYVHCVSCCVRVHILPAVCFFLRVLLKECNCRKSELPPGLRPAAAQSLKKNTLPGHFSLLNRAGAPEAAPAGLGLALLLRGLLAGAPEASPAGPGLWSFCYYGAY